MNRQRRLTTVLAAVAPVPPGGWNLDSFITENPLGRHFTGFINGVQTKAAGCYSNVVNKANLHTTIITAGVGLVTTRSIHGTVSGALSDQVYNCIGGATSASG